MNSSPIPLVATIAFAAALALGLCAACPAGQIDLAGSGEPALTIVVPAADAVLNGVGEWLQGFFERQGCRVAPVISRSLPDSGAAIALEVLDGCDLAHRLKVDLTGLSSARSDAFALSISDVAGNPTVSITGRNAQGVRSGVARLVALMQRRGNTITVPEKTELRSPFFCIRRLHVCPTGRIAQGNEWCKKMGLPDWYANWPDTLWTNWSDERLRQYAEQIWLMGFNSVELAEIRGYRGVFSDEQLRSEIAPRIRAFAQALRDNGLQVSQFIWGQSLFEEGQNLCWNAPDERAAMLAEYRRLARTYGDLVDHIVVHVGDPGGCSRNGCDPYKTTQEIATALYDEYRKVNPAVTATLSTWANEGFWKGRSGDQFLDTTHSPSTIGIALHRWYDPYHAAKVTSSGRPLDIWGWYLSDFELSLDSHLLMRRLDRYFQMLPPEASEQVRAVSTEINFSGWPHIINCYVSAQKMWDPKRDLHEIQREFVSGTFGDSNADEMLKVYKACEAYVHPENYYGFIPPTDCLPVVFGTPSYNSQLASAVRAADAVSLGSGFRPRLTSPVQPGELAAYLFRNLRLISIYSGAHQEMDRARDAEAPAPELAAIAARADSEAQPFSIDPDYPKLSADLKRAAGMGAP